MTISNHLFGLIQCYSEVGDCRVFDHSFNIMLMFPIELLIYSVIIVTIIFLLLKLYHYYFYPVDPMQITDTYDTGEPR